MKQLLQSTRTGSVEIADVPAPAVRPGGVLVQTESSALSVGTERMLAEFARKTLVKKATSRPDLVRQVMQKAKREGWRSTWQTVQARLDSSIPVGYSSAGTVIAAGDGGSPFQPGDRVACGGVGYATHSEVAFVPYNLCAKLPDGVSSEDAAFATIGAVGLHGLRLAEVGLNGTVAVIGLGIIGQLVVQFARAAGMRVAAIDPDVGRVALAREHGVDVGVVLDGDDTEEAMAALTNRVGVDAAIIAAASDSSKPLELAAKLCRDKGRVVAVGAVGLEVPRKLFFDKELELIVSRSYGPGRYDPAYEEHGMDYPIGFVRWTEQRNLETFVHLLSSGRVSLERIITHRFPIERADEAYALILGKGEAPFLGVTLTYADRPTRVVQQVDVRAPSSRSQSSERLGVAVVGAGNFARQVLLPKLRDVEGIDLVAVASAGGVSALDAARQFGFRRAVTGYEELLGDPDIHCVIVETRHNVHAKIAIAALEAGKSVFVEKPLALDEESLHAVALAWVRAGRPPATVGFNRRLAPMVQRMRDAQSSGRPPWSISLRVNAGTVPSNSWIVDPAIGGGRLLGEGCHFLDLAQHLAGSEPVEVMCIGPSPDQALRQGDSVTSLRFADGSVASIVYATAGSRSYGKERIELLGGGLVVTIDDYRVLELVDGSRRRTKKDRWAQDKGHANYLERFLNSVRTGRPFDIEFSEVVTSSLATIRAVQALKTGLPQTVDGAAFRASVGWD